MTSAIEEMKKPSFKRARKNNELFINEVPKQLYTVFVNKHRQQKDEELENKPDQESEVGLPPQPKAYIKYPDYDWL